MNQASKTGDDYTKSVGELKMLNESDVIHISGSFVMQSNQSHYNNLIGGILDLNGHNLTVNGCLLQSGGIISVNGGELYITEDYRIQSKSGDKYSDSSGILMMTDEADRVKVVGSFVMHSNRANNDYLTAGTLEIGGDLLQINGERNNFNTSGLHTVVLNGSSKQRVNLNSSSLSYSHITNLKVQNRSSHGVEFETIIYVTGKLYDTSSKILNGKNLYVTNTTDFVDNAWSADIYFSKTPAFLPDFYIGGSLYLYSDLVLGGDMTVKGSLYAYSDINMNEYTLEVGEDSHLNSLLYVNGGKLYVGNDLNITGSMGYLLMNNENEYVLVSGSVYIYAGKNTYLNKGIFEVKGDFTQKNYGSGVNISAADKVILSGNNVQTISVENTGFYFRACSHKCIAI